MTERERLLRILRTLDLPAGQWVLSGSGVMVMHGIPRSKPMGDVDIFLATRPWIERLVEPEWSVFTTDPEDPKRRSDPAYLYRFVEGLEVNLFSAWRRRGVGDIDVGWWIHNAEIVDGVPCISVEMLRDWKRTLGRAKDVDDILAMDEWLRRAA